MFNVWFCTIMSIEEDNYLSLSYDKLIYEEQDWELLERYNDIDDNQYFKDICEDFGYEFDRIDHDQYIRFKNNDKYCLFIEELLDDKRIDELKKQIEYLENKMQNCAYSKDDLYELENLKKELNKLESGE